MLVRFERVTYAVSISLSPWNSVFGRSVLPPIRAKGLVPAWTAPSYANGGKFSEGDVWIRPSWGFPAVQGTVTIPKSHEGEATRYPAVVMLGGSGLIDRDHAIGSNLPFRDLAWGLAGNNIAVFRMEKPLVESALRMFVTGDLTVEHEYVKPAVAALQTLRKGRRSTPTEFRPWCEPRRPCGPASCG